MALGDRSLCKSCKSLCAALVAAVLSCKWQNTGWHLNTGRSLVSLTRATWKKSNFFILNIFWGITQYHSFTFPVAVTGISLVFFVYTGCKHSCIVVVHCVVLVFGSAGHPWRPDNSPTHKMKDATKCPSFGPSWLSVFWSPPRSGWTWAAQRTVPSNHTSSQ